MVIIDPSGHVVPANIEPFEIEPKGPIINIQPHDVITDPASNVDKPANTAGLNGNICGFDSNVTLTYYYEWSTDCTLDSGVIRTPAKPLMTTGSCNQTVPTETVTNVAPGSYCYMLVPL